MARRIGGDVGECHYEEGRNLEGRGEAEREYKQGFYYVRSGQVDERSPRNGEPPGLRCRISVSTVSASTGRSPEAMRLNTCACRRAPTTWRRSGITRPLRSWSSRPGPGDARVRERARLLRRWHAREQQGSDREQRPIARSGLEPQHFLHRSFEIAPSDRVARSTGALPGGTASMSQPLSRQQGSKAGGAGFMYKAEKGEGTLLW